MSAWGFVGKDPEAEARVIETDRRTEREREGERQTELDRARQTEVKSERDSVPNS